jgi:diguanylate cyclase (GGDEF)-like protein
VLSVTRDISEAKIAQEEIRNLAFYDSLTRLPNRSLLLERLRQCIAAGSRSCRMRALLFVDLDDFKTLNDTLGHQTGDLLLQEVAVRLAASVREVDTVARLGGDEFVVMLEDLSENAEEAATQARVIGEKILTALSEPYQLDGHDCLSTSSVGATIFGDKKESISEILKQADIAMYQAKAAGRNTMRFFAPELQAAVNARATLESDLRQGIKSGQFVLWYQPLIYKGLIVGSEALLRWNHPLRGLLRPGEFIPLAEETGLIVPLGNWVVDMACNQIAAWARAKETAHLSLAINISALQFRQPGFVGYVLAALKSAGARPEVLQLELTETSLVYNVEDVIAKMIRLKVAGLRFSLDDFGTGYSSLAYLKRLPLDQLKIDRGFVRDILDDPTSRAIAKAVIDLAQAMDISVVAEGVETDQQHTLLNDLGCLSYQGYLFSPPLPLDEFQLLCVDSSPLTNFCTDARPEFFEPASAGYLRNCSRFRDLPCPLAPDT